MMIAHRMSRASSRFTGSGAMVDNANADNRAPQQRPAKRAGRAVLDDLRRGAGDCNVPAWGSGDLTTAGATAELLIGAVGASFRGVTGRRTKGIS